MTAIIIIGIIIFIIYAASCKKNLNPQKKIFTNSNNKQKPEKGIKVELGQNLLNNQKVTVTTLATINTNIDNSIIDVTNQPSENIKVLQENNSILPFYWKNKVINSFNDIYTASVEQRNFYSSFKQLFLKNIYVKLNDNNNYLYILVYDLLQENKLGGLIYRIGLFYPEIKEYAQNLLAKKVQAYSSPSYTQSNLNPDYYCGLGTKYQKELNLSYDEVEILNTISYYSNTFFDIKYCGTEIIKLFLILRKEIDLRYKSEGTDLNSNVSDIADVIVTKQLKYRHNTESYKYTIETYKRVIYISILKNCENAVREKFSHKRKLNADLEHINQEYKSEYETKITSNLLLLLPSLISTIALPDEATEIELYSQSTNRWKIKFEELTISYNENPKEFIDSIISLGKLNKKNPSIENIFFEASKFIAKYDKQSALSLYVYYLYHDLKSATFDNKKLTKTIQKSLFKTNEQLHDFEIIVSELIKDKDLDKALKSVSKVYEVKRKKIQLDTASIKEVQQQHSGTVELLNEYLKDDFEDENNTIKSQEISNEEIKIEITQKNEEVHQSAFLSQLAFSEIHTTALDLFAKSNFSVPQNELELFAKSKGIFKNQLVESINDTCYDFLDDVLIEEEDDYYTINTNYFQSISAK